MKKWECTVCGYIHEGEEPPDECPVCGADANMFEQVFETSDPGAETVNETSGKKENIVVEEQSLIKKVDNLILQFHLHPIMVHTPNGIIPFTVLLVFLAAVSGAQSFESAAFYSLIFVLLNMPIVLYTGYITWQEKYQSAMTSFFKIKIGASIIATLILLLLIVWRLVNPEILISPSSGKYFFIFLCFVLLAAVGTAGHLGGKLVFGK